MKMGSLLLGKSLKSTFKAVGDEEFLHEKTVREIFIKWSKAEKINSFNSLRVLGIDELSLKKRHKQFALILSDLERNCVLAVLEGRKKVQLEDWLKKLEPLVRKGIKVVSIDMWVPYKEAVKAILPHAEIVADRFHVMKQLNERLSQIRRSIQKKADKETQEVLKGSRWILLKNRDELTEKEEEKLCKVLEACSELRKAYLLKEEFRTIFNKIKSREQGERFLRAWMCKVSMINNRTLNKFVNTLRNWWKEILNYFNERITNGFVEGLNRAIRTIINQAYGYRNFEMFRLKVLTRHGLLAPFSHKFT